ARVMVKAQTKQGLLEDEFVQTMKLKWQGATVEWDRDLALSREGYSEGLAYRHQGAFSYEVRLKPSLLYTGRPAPESARNPIYFTRLIDAIDVGFSYEFVPRGHVSWVETGVETGVEISALLEDPGVWRREVVLVPAARRNGGGITADFPLDLEGLLGMAGDISRELGLETPSPDITIKARVMVKAQTEQGLFEDEFVQTMKLRVRGATLEWDRDLARTVKGLFDGLAYEHRGSFDYAIRVRENMLYDSTTLGPEPPPSGPAPEPIVVGPDFRAVAPAYEPIVLRQFMSPPEPAVALARSRSYPAGTTETIDVTFTYQVESDGPLRQVVHEVEVTASLGNPGGEGKTFVLVPKSEKTGNLELTFPLDMDLFYDLLVAAGEDSAPTPLTVEASVKTSGRSEFGPVEESFNQTLQLMLEPDEILWPEAEPQATSGAIRGTEAVSNPDARTARVGFLGGLGVMGMVLLYATWGYWEARRKRISGMDGQYLKARARHRELLIEITALPAERIGDTVVPIGSLKELIRAADALLKPVLHQGGPRSHTYCVIDGATRFLYVSRLEEAP
ncbi:MAG: DUF5305 family protein, partial [Dehalococcoidia bacterium]